MELVYLPIGCVLGGVAGWLLGARKAKAEGDPAKLAAAQERVRGEVGRREAAEARTEKEQAARTDAERREAATLEQHRQAAAQVVEERAFVARARTELENAFKATAAGVLKDGTGQFLDLAKERLGGLRAQAGLDLDARKTAIHTLLKPLAESLGKLEGQAGAMERARVEAYSKIDTQVASLTTAAAGLQREPVLKAAKEP